MGGHDGKIAECLRRGELLDLAPDLVLGSPVDEMVMQSWDASHSLDADEIRELLRGRKITDPDPRGLRLRAARIRGRLDLDNLITTVKLTLLDCLLDEGITAGAAHLPGLALRRCLLTHPSKPAVNATELRTDASVSFDGSTIRAYSTEGAVRLTLARLGGSLDCSGAKIKNSSGPALHAERLQVDGNIFLRAGFTAKGQGSDSTVRLTLARVGGQLDCSGAKIKNSSGPALHAEHLQVDGNVLLTKDFTAEGVGPDSAVRLPWARIGGSLHCSGAKIENTSGPALWAGALQVSGSVYLRTPFTANGAGQHGAVRLVGAHIHRQLDCSGATIDNPSGPALHGEHLQVDNDVLLCKDVTLGTHFIAKGHGPDGAIRLVGARIGGQFDCSGAHVTTSSDERHRWTLDGLTYPRLPLDPLGEGRDGWLYMLRTATPCYAAQPYQQLASVYRAAGHDRDVRQILIAQRKDHLSRRDQQGRRMLTRHERLWARITGIFLGYGYQPWRALLYLLVVAVTSVVLAIVLGAHGALTHPQDTKSPTAAVVSCTVAERVGVGLEVGAPFLDTHSKDSCTTTTTATGIALTYSIWGLQLLTRMLAALFIVGFTGIVRKT